MMFTNTKWIWADAPLQNDCYAEFYDRFLYEEGRAEIMISADSNYAVYVNGVLAESGQYPDYPHYKVADLIDLTKYCVEGDNDLAIVVWHYGASNMSYFPGKAAVYYEVYADDKPRCHSCEKTLSRISRTYHNGLEKNITGQLGFSFAYDLTKEDNWMRGELDGFSPSVIVPQDPVLNLRPVNKCVIGQPQESACIKAENGTHYLYDLGKESVGFLTVKLSSEKEQSVKICYGEHIVDGGVRWDIGGRDFSVELQVRAGENTYMNPFRRLGLRYLEVFAEAPVAIETMTVTPVDYPFKHTGKAPSDPLRKRIWDASVKTLELCVHDHYEDTPWREQALYAMDSRNQMLCGYYAFSEYRMPRATLLLMSKDNREDGLLPICIPNDGELTIPSFSLHYFTSVLEYTRHSGDITLLRIIWNKLVSLMDVFIRQMDGDALLNWTDKWHWNFYEWSEGLSGNLFEETPKTFDAALNCLFSIALQNMQTMADLLGKEADYGAIAEKVNASVNAMFYSEARGEYKNSITDEKASELVNALAILCGAADGERAKAIAEKLASAESGFTPATLSMLCFKYDALLKVDASYKDYILVQIDAKYERMLDAGATTFWETELGEADFDGAGSLCHAWSAMPVYYYSTLLDE